MADLLSPFKTDMKILAIILAVALGSLFLSAREPAKKKSSSHREPWELSNAELKRVQRFEREREEATRISEEIQKDKRRPTRENISGNWSTGPNLVGISFQLEQDGQKISGRGYGWGCLGVNSPFKIAGTYREGRLDITVTSPDGEKSRDVMVFVERGGYPRFDSKLRDRSWYFFETDYESAERNAKLEAEQESAERSAKQQ